MAADYVPFFLVVAVLSTTESFNLTEKGDKDFDVKSHLKLEIVQKYCSHRDDACKSNKVKICAVKMKNGTKYHQDFLNDCYLFLSNMCDYPGEEFYLASETSCEEYLTRRRSNEVEDDTNSTTEVNLTTEVNPSNEVNSTTEVNSTIEANSTSEVNSAAEINSVENRTETAAEVLREGSYSDDEDKKAYDGHWCPYSCPDIYVPECMIVNRQAGGKDLRMYYFINHCLADAFYCTHWAELPTPEDEEHPEVRHSPISWTACASSRFIQFSRFAEAASSMAHYGWLAGPYRATHIMEPHQRIPGFG